MSLTIIWSPRAEDSLIHILDEIAKDNPFAAMRVVAAIQAEVTILGSFPNLGRAGWPD
jgi:plasmid stabilization system protein ParE